MVRVELAPLAAVNDVIGVGDGSRPVEILSKGVADQSSWSDMVSTYSATIVLLQLPPLVNRNALLQDAGGTSFVEFSLDEDE